MATDERVGVWLSEIGSVLQGTGFVTKHRDFINKNCDTFSEDEENKLEYTNIFEEYVGFVEEAIEKGMKDKSGDFNMEQLMEALPSYVEREGSKGMPANQSELEGPAKTIDMLLGLGEFESLKATMLLAKRDKAEKKDGGNESMFAVSVEDGVVGTDLEGLLAASGPQFTVEKSLPSWPSSPCLCLVVLLPIAGTTIRCRPRFDDRSCCFALVPQRLLDTPLTEQ